MEREIEIKSLNELVDIVNGEDKEFIINVTVEDEDAGSHYDMINEWNIHCRTHIYHALSHHGILF